MVRIAIAVIMLIFALQGPASAQGGLLDSIFGPSGLGLWSSDSSSQFNPQTYSGYQNPGMPGQQPSQGYPQPAAGYPQGYAPPGYAPQGQGYYPPQQGLYSDWQNYPYGVPGASPQTQYSPPQYSAPQQYQQPQQQYQGPPAGVQTGPGPRGAAATPTLRPGQYSPGQLPTSSDDLPPGAVSVTTTTPEGTRVEYYPPAGEPTEGVQGAVRQRPRQLRQSSTGGSAPAARRTQPKEQATVGGTTSGSAPIAMPRPVEIPRGQDPRTGWGPAVNR